MKALITLATVVAAASLFYALPATAEKHESVDPQTDKTTAKKPARPHSRFEEKTGAPVTAVQRSPEKADPWRDTSRHFHPRDGK